jgi:hypothetical protein
MKKNFPMLIIFLLIFLVNIISATDLKGKFSLTVKGGVPIPFGNFAGKYEEPNELGAKVGFGFGGTGEYFITDNISVGVGFMYDIHSINEEAVFADLSWKVMNYGAFSRYLFTTDSKVFPYIKFDIGFYTLKYSVSVDGGEMIASYGTKLGIAAGVGLFYQISPSFLLSGELIAHNAFTKSAEYENSRLDVNIQYMSFSVGVTFLSGRTK